MMGYYDAVLGLIPASFIGLTALFYLGGLPTTVAVPLGSLAAIGLIGHAMFVRSPAGESAGSPSEVGTASVSDVVAD